MKYLFPIKKHDLIKNILFYFLILCYIHLSINSSSEEYKLKEIEVPKYIAFNNIQDEKYITFNLELSNEDISSDKNYYFHFSTFPVDSSDKNGQQIIYSSTKEMPSISNADRYSFKYLEKSHLFVNFQNINELYLTIKCYKYPCSFNLKTQIEKDYANLNLLDFDSYSYFISEQKINTMKFKIPSLLNNLNSINDNTQKYMLTVSVTNPSDPEYSKLSLISGNNEKTLKMMSYKSSMNMIYSVIEEDNINDLSENNFYVLEIESMQNQFISISIKISFINNNKINSEIIPNSSPKYSYLNATEIRANEECYIINGQYISDYLDNNNENDLLYNNENDLLYASIEYFSSPVNIYLKYNDKNVNPKESINLEETSINVILEKVSNQYPQICFDLSEKDAAAFMLEVSHISQTSKNIDIYNPLVSGFFHKKSLKRNGLSLFTHNSDVHYIKQMTFYVKILKGEPEIYIYNCEDYPNCYNDIYQLKNDNSVIKPKISNNISSYTINTNDFKDLSPYYPEQNLLYVYCPQNEQEYCQFQILMYSNLDEIVLSPNYKFYSNLQKDNIDLYRIHLPKGKDEIKKIQVLLYSNEVPEFISYNMSNITINKNIGDNMQIYEYIPDKNYLINNKDFDILFNIKAKENIFYYIEYNIINKDGQHDDNYDIFLGKIGAINETNSMPSEMFYSLPLKKDKVFNEFLFNLYFKSKKTVNTKTAIFDKLEINAAIISKNSFIQFIQNQKNDINKYLVNTALFDISTKSAIINIKTEDMANAWIQNNKEDEDLILFIQINNNNKDSNNLNGKFFLNYKNNEDFIFQKNKYISDQLYIYNHNNFNLYHLQSDSEERNLFIVEFSSNYPLEKKYLNIYFIDHYNIEDNPENINSNSKDVEIINKKYIGGVNYIEFKLNNNKKDIFLFVLFKEPKNLKENENELKSINYIFRYNTYKSDSNEYKNRAVYQFNDVVNFKNNNNTKTTLLTLEKTKKIIDNKEEYPSGEIYIKKILKENKKENEDLDTIAIIESKYELMTGNIA